MKTVKKLFRANRTEKDLRLIRKIYALLTLPVFLVQMTSFNLFLLAPTKVLAEETTVAAEATSTPAPAQEEKKADAPTVSTPKEQPAAENVAPEVKTPEVTEPALNEEPKIAPTETPVVPTEPTIDPQAASIEVPNTTPATPEASVAEPAAPQTNVAASATQQSKEPWSTEKSKATTNDSVELGKTYIAPQNDQVSVTFTKLPKDAGKLSIEEITLTDKQVALLGALSNKAYDITSDMADGTFEYSLTLPKPAGQNDIQIKYAENVTELENANSISGSDLKTSNDQVSANLNHFTIFVATIATFSNDNYNVNKGSYAQGETVFIKASHLNHDKNYKIVVKNPFSTVKYTSSCVSLSEHETAIEREYKLASDAPVGTWTTEIVEFSNSHERGHEHDGDNCSGSGSKKDSATFEVTAICQANSSVYTKNSDFADSKISLDFSRDRNSISVAAKSGYKITKVELDVKDDGHNGYFTYANHAIFNFNPAPGKEIDNARITFEKDCPSADNIAPTVSQNENIFVQASNPLGEVVTFETPTAQDNVDQTVDVICSPASGSTFLLGTTTVTCTATDTTGNVGTSSFDVVIQDTSLPVLTINEGTDTIEVHTSFTDSGATWTDNFDGSGTIDAATSGSVDTDTIGDYTLSYEYTDGAGNTASADRIVRVVDTTKPVITLLGDPNTKIHRGESYNDAGATAFDNYDGDLTAKIVVTSTVDSRHTGDFTVTYSVTDAAGNVADQVVRNVNVHKQHPGKGGKKHSESQTATTNLFRTGNGNNPLLTGAGNGQENVAGAATANEDNGAVLGENTDKNAENVLPVNTWKYGILLLIAALSAGGYLFWKKRHSNPTV